MSNWTPEPWRSGVAGSKMRDKYSQSHCVTSADHRQMVGGYFMDVSGGEDQAAANAARVAACVNACTGMADPEREIAALRANARRWLEANAPGGWIDDLRRGLNSLTA